jgi:hypothetical protein
MKLVLFEHERFACLKIANPEIFQQRVLLFERCANGRPGAGASLPPIIPSPENGKVQSTCLARQMNVNSFRFHGPFMIARNTRSTPAHLPCALLMIAMMKIRLSPQFTILAVLILSPTWVGAQTTRALLSYATAGSEHVRFYDAASGWTETFRTYTGKFDLLTTTDARLTKVYPDGSIVVRDLLLQWVADPNAPANPGKRRKFLTRTTR